MASQLDLLGLDWNQGRKDAQRNLEFLSLTRGYRPEPRVLEGCCPRCVRYRKVQRGYRHGIADAAPELPAEIERREDTPKLQQVWRRWHLRQSLIAKKGQNGLMGDAQQGLSIGGRKFGCSGKVRVGGGRIRRPGHHSSSALTERRTAAAASQTYGRF